MKPPTKPAAPRLACPTKLPKALIRFSNDADYKEAVSELREALMSKTKWYPNDFAVAVIPLRTKPTLARLDAVQRLLSCDGNQLFWELFNNKECGELKEAEATAVLRALGLLAPAQKGKDDL